MKAILLLALLLVARQFYDESVRCLGVDDACELHPETQQIINDETTPPPDQPEYPSEELSEILPAHFQTKTKTSPPNHSLKKSNAATTEQTIEKVRKK